MDSTAVGRDEFTAIMAAFPTGVAVVTTLDAAGAPKGFASNAVTSVSAEPPLLLVCVDRTSRTLPSLLARGAFCVNFLKDGRHEICRKFASKCDDKFEEIAWMTVGSGLPLLTEDSLAHAECVTESIIEAGDHLIVIGRVVAGRPPAEEERPLAYYRRCYGQFAPCARP